MAQAGTVTMDPSPAATSSFYDLSPILEHDTVSNYIKSSGMQTYRPLTVPESVYPSPLAPNITPEQLIQFKKRLVGPHNEKPGCEIWLSWKRAWDLWNGYYIEGRIDKGWLKREYERRKAERKSQLDNSSGRQWRRPRVPEQKPKEPKVYETAACAVEELRTPAPGRKWVRGAMVKISVGTGRKRQADTGKKKQMARKVIRTRVIPNQEMVTWGVGQMELVVEEAPVMKDVQVQRITGAEPYYPVASSADVVKARQESENALQSIGLGHEGVMREDLRDVTEMESVKRVVMEQKNVEVEQKREKKLSTWDEAGEYRRKGQKLDLITTNEPGTEVDLWKETVKVWTPVVEKRLTDKYAQVKKEHTEIGWETERYEETEFYEVDADAEEEVLEEVLVQSWELVDDLDNPVKNKRKKRNEDIEMTDAPDHVKNKKQKKVGLQMGDDEKSSDQDDTRMDLDNDNYEGSQEDVEIVSDSESDGDGEIKWISKTVDENGLSGGFRPLKNNPEFQKTGDDDIISNAVWRPRRVGEVEVQVDLDNLDLIRGRSEFDVDGGVDCGPLPYPCLRWTTVHIRNCTINKRINLYRKRKIWDRVTGTLFNIPTLPEASSKEQLKDQRHLLARAIYGPGILTPPATPPIFPLDVRRCEKILPIDQPDSILGNQEVEINFEWENPTKSYRPMERTDPWWVTANQEFYRDVPPHRWPPAEDPADLNHRIFPFDDNHWLANKVTDSRGRAGYFVTNLTEGTLIINGMEVRKGRIAGPLPSFAIIQSPGGQVSFWFGNNGRNYLPLTWANDRPPPEAQFKMFRLIKGWEHCGVPSGVVWDKKLIDKLKREEEYEESPDDEEFWDVIKAYEEPAKAPKEPAETGLLRQVNSEQDLRLQLDVGIGPHRRGSVIDILAPQIFRSEEDELKYYACEAEILQEKALEVQEQGQLDEPQGSGFWPGSNPGRLEQRLKDKIEDAWNQDSQYLITEQKKWVGSGARKLEIDEGKKKIFKDPFPQAKRKGQGFEILDAKRRFKEQAIAAKRRLDEKKKFVAEAAEIEEIREQARKARARKLLDEIAIEALMKQGHNRIEAVKRHTDQEVREASSRAAQLRQLNEKRKRQGLEPIEDTTPENKLSILERTKRNREKRAEDNQRKALGKEEDARKKVAEIQKVREEQVRKAATAQAKLNQEKFQEEEQKRRDEERTREEDRNAARLEEEQKTRIREQTKEAPIGQFIDYSEFKDEQMKERFRRWDELQSAGLTVQEAEEETKGANDRQLSTAYRTYKLYHMRNKTKPAAYANGDISYLELEVESSGAEPQQSIKAQHKASLTSRITRQDSRRETDLERKTREIKTDLLIRAKTTGYNTTLEYIHALSANLYTEDQYVKWRLETEDPKRTQTNLQKDNEMYVYARQSAQVGIQARAEIEGITQRQVVQQKGFDTIVDYLDYVKNRITPISHLSTKSEMEATIEKNCRTVVEELGDWEARTLLIERRGLVPAKKSGNERSAVV